MRRIVALMVVALSTACASQPQRDDAQDRAAVDSIRLEAETANAKYLWLYHRNNRTWELARLMWNSSDPAAPVPAQPSSQPR